MPHQRSPYAEERALVLSLAVFDHAERELIAQDTFSLIHFTEGEVLHDRYNRGSLDQLHLEVKNK